jgi:hypothetical protein
LRRAAWSAADLSLRNCNWLNASPALTMSSI